MKDCPVIWRGRASQDAFGIAMNAFHGRSPKPRPICVRNHDRPMRHRKSPTASKLFVFIQFVDASDARLNALQVRLSETRTRLKTPKLRLDEQAINQATTRLNAPPMSLQSRTLLLNV
ncbi:MAG TPA: hypothetical protein VEH75_04435 [Xanthobacteraceae bacterium]|nr:hypothetical protein [Xanthobacteraceae bacterium]